MGLSTMCVASVIHWESWDVSLADKGYVQGEFIVSIGSFLGHSKSACNWALRCYIQHTRSTFPLGTELCRGTKVMVLDHDSYGGSCGAWGVSQGHTCFFRAHSVPYPPTTFLPLHLGVWWPSHSPHTSTSASHIDLPGHFKSQPKKDFYGEISLYLGH